MAKGFIVRIERKLLVFLLIVLVSFQIDPQASKLTNLVLNEYWGLTVLPLLKKLRPRS